MVISVRAHRGAVQGGTTTKKQVVLKKWRKDGAVVNVVTHGWGVDCDVNQDFANVDGLAEVDGGGLKRVAANINGEGQGREDFPHPDVKR